MKYYEHNIVHSFRMNKKGDGRFWDGKIITSAKGHMNARQGSFNSKALVNVNTFTVNSL